MSLSPFRFRLLPLLPASRARWPGIFCPRAPISFLLREKLREREGRRRRSKRPKVGSQNLTKSTSLQSINSNGGKSTTLRTTDGRPWGLSQALRHSPGIIIGCCILRVLQLLIMVLIEALCPHHSSVSLHSYKSSLSL
jgi:hypothetical protein